MTGDL